MWPFYGWNLFVSYQNFFYLWTEFFTFLCLSNKPYESIQIKIMWSKLKDATTSLCLLFKVYWFKGIIWVLDCDWHITIDVKFDLKTFQENLFWITVDWSWPKGNETKNKCPLTLFLQNKTINKNGVGNIFRF